MKKYFWAKASSSITVESSRICLKPHSEVVPIQPEDNLQAIHQNHFFSNTIITFNYKKLPLTYSLVLSYKSTK